MTTAASGAAAEDVVGIVDPFVRWTAGEVRAHLARKGVRQAELSRRLNVSQQWVSTRIKGQVPMTMADLARIASVLGMQPLDLLSGMSQPPGPGAPGSYSPLTRGNATSAFLPLPQVRALAVTDSDVRDGALAPVIRIRPDLRSNAAPVAS